MLTEDNDPTKPAGVLDNAGNVSSSADTTAQHPRTGNTGIIKKKNYVIAVKFGFYASMSEFINFRS